MKNFKGILKKFILICAVLSLILLCGCSEGEAKYPTPTKEFYINDFADVIDTAAGEEILSRGVKLQKETLAQIVVVTVESTGDEEIADYALNIGREWGVGDEDEDNGVVVLLATKDREIHISVGYGLEGILPDTKVGRILDVYGVPYFESDLFSEGLLSVYKALENEVYFEYGLETDQDFLPINNISTAEEETNFVQVLISWAVLIIVVLIYIKIFGARGLIFLGGYGRFGSFGGGSSFGGFKGGGGSFGGGGAGRRF